MNAQKIIQDSQMKRDEKMIYLYLAKMFDHGTPATLYLNHYELAHGEPDSQRHKDDYWEGAIDTTPDQWEQFLEIPEIYRYRMGKIAKLAEFDAVKAMKKLGNAADTSSLKEIIKSSKALQGGQAQQTIIMSYVTPKQYS